MSEPELSKAYDPTDVERRWSPVWNEAGYFRAEPSSSKPAFCIVLPPPNVTGSLHLGHALTATIQDILVRWKRMGGFNCLWLPGIDHAGIATQMVVERELQKTEKKSRHDLGREEFLRRVWQWKEKYGARIGEQHQVLGASLDWSRERFTMDAGVSAAVKEVFVRLHEQGLLYRDEKLINWDPQLLTALSDLEVDHQDREGSLWHISYPVKGSDERLTVATTRPETMLGDTAVAVHPEDPRYQHLIGKFVVLPLVGREIPIIADAELVSMEFGTGAVKITPAHDHNDYAVGKRHDLPMISIFDENAVCNHNAGPYQGLERFVARTKVLEDLAALGLLVKEEAHRLSLAISQRTGVAVEPRLSPQWFVRVQPMADKAIAAVEQGQTKFVPESWTNTFYGWMRNIHDWCVSRQLWWGHQIPAWYPADGPKLADGTLDFTQAVPTVARERPGATEANPSGAWVQDPDVLDTWFSSGLWPFSTLGWPQQTAELKTFYPNAVMETGHDIIFFWVARMMMLGLHFMGEVPFRTVYLHAMVRDEKGEKMSKTKGNVIDPIDIIRGADAAALPPSVRNRFPQGMPAMGADALRFTLAALTQQGRDIKLSIDRIGGYKAFCNKVWNAARFALMNLGDFRWDGAHPKGRTLTLADRWILARLDRCVGQTQAALGEYRFSDAASTLYQFLWGEFCDWYIELSKAALNGEDAQARDSARTVLVFSLDRILRLLHPFMPFITEEIWQKLPMERPTASICIAAYPESDARLEDFEAEAEMAPVIAAIDGVRTLRGESNLSPAVKVEAHVLSNDPAVRHTLEKWKSYVMPLTGVKALHVAALGARPPLAAAELRGTLEIYVPLAGVIDLTEERSRLQKEIGKAEGQLKGIERKLENPNFVAKAPPEVVEKDRAQIAELQARVRKLGDTLERLTEPQLATVEEGPEGTRDIGKELHDQLPDFEVPQAHQDVKDGLETLRARTQEGLSSKDHYDLGVAYMGMGLVDDAVREFNTAKATEGDAPAAKSKAPKSASRNASSSNTGPAAKSSAPKGSARKAGPAGKKATAGKKVPAGKKAAAGKKATAKKATAGKKATAKKAPVKASRAKASSARAGLKKAPPPKRATASKQAAARTRASGAKARKAAPKRPAPKRRR